MIKRLVICEDCEYYNYKLSYEYRCCCPNNTYIFSPVHGFFKWAIRSNPNDTDYPNRYGDCEFYKPKSEPKPKNKWWKFWTKEMK